MNIRTHSHVLATPPAAPEAAQAHFLGKLSFETDPADVHTDMQNGIEGFVVIDVRSPAAYAEEHVVGAVNLPHQAIDEQSTASFDRDTLYVVYCWGPGCNGSTKAALKLSALGFKVKEMIGGLEYWAERERLPVERKPVEGATT